LLCSLLPPEPAAASPACTSAFREAAAEEEEGEEEALEEPEELPDLGASTRSLGPTGTTLG
jgi:hypothetical protein